MLWFFALENRNPELLHALNNESPQLEADRSGREIQTLYLHFQSAWNGMVEDLRVVFSLHSFDHLLQSKVLAKKSHHKAMYYLPQTLGVSLQ